jgi:hypothetical protein
VEWTRRNLGVRRASARIFAQYCGFCPCPVSEKLFYRRAEEIQQLPIEKRIAGHLDNQFWPLREDKLSDIREELQAVNKKNKKRRKGKLSLEEVLSGTEKQMTDSLRPGHQLSARPRGSDNPGQEMSKGFSEERRRLSAPSVIWLCSPCWRGRVICHC